MTPKSVLMRLKGLRPRVLAPPLDLLATPLPSRPAPKCLAPTCSPLLHYWWNSPPHRLCK